MHSMPAGDYEQPHAYVVVKVQKPDEAPIFRVLAAWRGGYLDGESWRFSSRLVKVQNDEAHWVVTTETGTRYELKKSAYSYGLSNLTAGIFANLEKQSNEAGIAVEIVGVERLPELLAGIAE